MTITPDTKNWTWVVERACPECGFDASTFPASNVGAALRQNLIAWPLVLRRSDVRQRPRPDVWSPLEYACHVRDVCRTYDQRVELMLTEDDPTYPNWDQDETAVAERYSEQDPQLVAEQLTGAGSRLANLFDSVSGGQWERPGSRSDGARFTVDTISRYFLHDLVHHLWDVTGQRVR